MAQAQAIPTEFTLHQKTHSAPMPAKPFVVVHFQLMPTTNLVLPDPLTTEQRAQVGQNQLPYISMPDLQICQDYVDWVDTYPGSDELPYCFRIEEKDHWLKTHTEEDLAKMNKSFLKRGHPPENWIYTKCIDRDKRAPHGFPEVHTNWHLKCRFFF